MQIEVPQRNRTAIPLEGVKMLLKLYGSKQMEFTQVMRHMGMCNAEFSKLVSELQREYLVDVVTYLDGRYVKECLSLTERGERIIYEIMEKTYELPE